MAEKQRSSGSGAKEANSDASASDAQKDESDEDCVTITGVWGGPPAGGRRGPLCGVSIQATQQLVPSRCCIAPLRLALFRSVSAAPVSMNASSAQARARWMILSRILGSCAPSILVAVFEKAWKEKIMGQWSNYIGMILKEMLLNPSKLNPKHKTNVEAGNLCAFDVSLFALVLVHDPGCKGLIGKNKEVVKAILELARLRNEWSHDRQLSQTLTEGEFYDLWQQADKNLNVLARWVGSETMQLLQRTMNEISQEVISDQAHKVPQHDFSNGAGSHLHGALVTSLTCSITCAPHYQAWRDSQKTKETNAQKRERYLLLYPAVGGEGEVGKGGLGGGHQQQRKKARTTAKTANEQPPKLTTEDFLWRPCRGTERRS